MKIKSTKEEKKELEGKCPKDIKLINAILNTSGTGKLPKHLLGQ